MGYDPPRIVLFSIDIRWPIGSDTSLRCFPTARDEYNGAMPRAVVKVPLFGSIFSDGLRYCGLPSGVLPVGSMIHLLKQQHSSSRIFDIGICDGAT